jgi:hypothetical protein
VYPRAPSTNKVLTSNAKLCIQSLLQPPSPHLWTGAPCSPEANVGRIWVLLRMPSFDGQRTFDGASPCLFRPTLAFGEHGAPVQGWGLGGWRRSWIHNFPSRGGGWVAGGDPGYTTFCPGVDAGWLEETLDRQLSVQGWGWVAGGDPGYTTFRPGVGAGWPEEILEHNFLSRGGRWVAGGDPGCTTFRPGVGAGWLEEILDTQLSVQGWSA